MENLRDKLKFYAFDEVFTIQQASKLMMCIEPDVCVSRHDKSFRKAGQYEEILKKYLNKPEGGFASKDEIVGVLKKLDIQDCFFNPKVPLIKSKIEPESRKPPYLDSSNKSLYSVELDIAVQAHKAIFIDHWKPERGPKLEPTARIKAWMLEHYPDASDAFVNRISSVANVKPDYKRKKIGDN